MKCVCFSPAVCLCALLTFCAFAAEGNEQAEDISEKHPAMGSHPGSGVDVNQPMHDRCLMKSLASMMRDAADVRGRSGEFSAFIVTTNGQLSLQRWRSSAAIWSERFSGIVPENAVAVVHTHPPQWERPSASDAKEARRIGLPFFVVSYWRIWVVLPDSGRVAEVANAGWWRVAEREGCTATPVPEHRTARNDVPVSP